MKKLLAMLLLPLSLVPVALAVPRVAGEHESFVARYVDRDALAAPDVPASAPVSVPGYRDRIPVLLYHGINDGGGRWTLTQEDFARQMAALAAAGFHTVSADDYAAFARGEDVDLPSRPVLITFDDGRVDSFRGSDAILDQHGFRATIFAIANATADGSRTYLGPDELQDLQASDRWDVRFHGGEGHTRIETAEGPRPFYAGLADGESVQDFRTRVEADLDAGVERLGGFVGDATLDDLFAVPFSDFGQTRDGDNRLSVLMAHAALSRFSVLFVQSSVVRPTRRGEAGILTRFEPTTDTSPETLLRKLRQGVTASARQD